jgi:uncharacterized membrane protein
MQLAAATTLKPCAAAAAVAPRRCRSAVVVRATAEEPQQAVSRRWGLFFTPECWLCRACLRQQELCVFDLASCSVVAAVLRSAVALLAALPALLAATPALALGKDVRKAMQE